MDTKTNRKNALKTNKNKNKKIMNINPNAPKKQKQFIEIHVLKQIHKNKQETPNKKNLI